MRETGLCTRVILLYGSSWKINLPVVQNTLDTHSLNNSKMKSLFQVGWAEEGGWRTQRPCILFLPYSSLVEQKHYARPLKKHNRSRRQKRKKVSQEKRRPTINRPGRGPWLRGCHGGRLWLMRVSQVSALRKPHSVTASQPELVGTAGAKARCVQTEGKSAYRQMNHSSCPSIRCSILIWWLINQW